MARSRPQPTLADYMAIAISPALIMVLVSSLAYFLLTVFYAGDFQQRVYWTTTCFVFAAVLISRVSIIEGAERASMFGLALGVAAAVAMVQYLERPLGAWLVLGVIWWCSSQLVWNCTLVDDDQDASGEGLLEAAGFEKSLGDEPAPAPVPALTSAAARLKRKKQAAAPPPAPTGPPLPLWKRFFTWWQRSYARTAPPGLTVVYFSLAALPIFGIGQKFIGEPQRQYAFQLMLRYVASALGLLLMTSFLGLRRYLRQRRLEMPIEMAGTWLTVGTVMGIAIVVLAILIPRPQPEYAISSLTGSVGSPSRKASDYAVMHDSPAQGLAQSTAPAEKQSPQMQSPGTPNHNPAQPSAAGGQQAGKTQGGAQQAQGQDSQSSNNQGQSSQSQQSTGQQGGDQQQGGGQQSGGQQQGNSGGAGNQQNQNQQGDQKQSSGGQGSDGKDQTAANQQQQSQQQQSQQQGTAGQQQQKSNPFEQNQQRQNSQSPAEQQQSASQMAQALSEHQQSQFRLSQPQMPQGSGLLWLLKMAMYVIVALIGIYCLIRYWPQIRDWLVRLWRELVSLWNELFGRRTIDAADAEEAAAVPRPRPFASFEDPFASGAARRQPPNAIVKYSFEALEAWAAERDEGRAAEETPLEFAARVAAAHQPLSDGVHDLASLYARIAYAQETLGPECLPGIERLWVDLQRAPQVAAAR